MKRVSSILLLCSVLVSASAALADGFGSGANSFAIDFVAVGSPDNPPDANPNPAGAVPYSYRIGKYEVSEEMIDKANALGGLGIAKDARGPDMPATSLTWYETARFVNWLNTSKGSSPAYKFDVGGNFQLWLPSDPGYDATNLYRNNLAKYFLPSLNEWHKAAYYDAAAGVYYDYPTGSDGIPDGIDFVGDTIFDAVFFDGGNNLGPNTITTTGLASPYGTFGQGGNVSEWEETAGDRVNSIPGESRGFRGGSWGTGNTVLLAENRNGIGPSFENIAFGFRVGSKVPEPAVIVLVGWGLLAFALMKRRPAMSIR